MYTAIRHDLFRKYSYHDIGTWVVFAPMPSHTASYVRCDLYCWSDLLGTKSKNISKQFANV